MRRPLLFAVLLLLGAAAPAGEAPVHEAPVHEASGPVVAGNADDAGVVIVNVQGYRFEPAEITVKVGTTVRWVNTEKRQFHNIWFPELDNEGRDYFFPDEIRERTFDRPGTWRYICEPHDASHQMRGVVHVVE